MVNLSHPSVTSKATEMIALMPALLTRIFQLDGTYLMWKFVRMSYNNSIEIRNTKITCYHLVSTGIYNDRNAIFEHILVKFEHCIIGDR